MHYVLHNLVLSLIIMQLCAFWSGFFKQIAEWEYLFRSIQVFLKLKDHIVLIF